MVLEHSDLPDVSLQDELEVLDLYLSLEKLRFKNDMQYRFEIDKDLDTEEVRIPPMLIQPHIENAIWHGLRHQEGNKCLKLAIMEISQDYLKVMVEDNGIGRTRSGEMKAKQIGGNRHTSKGRTLSENRIELLKKNYPMTSIITQDLYKHDGLAAGTRIEMIIPVLNHQKETSNPISS
jgi:LytS/YehU family sensor histidine kinase